MFWAELKLKKQKNILIYDVYISMFVPGASKQEEFLLLLFKSLVTDAHREVPGQGSELGSCPVFKPFQKAAKEQLHLRLRIVFLMMTVPYVAMVQVK